MHDEGTCILNSQSLITFPQFQVQLLTSRLSRAIRPKFGHIFLIRPKPISPNDYLTLRRITNLRPNSPYLQLVIITKKHCTWDWRKIVIHRKPSPSDLRSNNLCGLVWNRISKAYRMQEAGHQTLPKEPIVNWLGSADVTGWRTSCYSSFLDRKEIVYIIIFTHGGTYTCPYI